MSCATIIYGPAGSGKTTLAEQLGSRIHGAVVPIDDVIKGVCRPNRPVFPLPTRAKDAIDIAIEYSRPILKEGTPVVFEWYFPEEHQLQKLRHGLSEFDCVIFNLKAPVEICIQRDAKRHPARRLGEATIRDVHERVSRTNVGTPVDTHKNDIPSALMGMIAYLSATQPQISARSVGLDTGKCFTPPPDSAAGL